MASPLNIFRHNKKILMAGILVMSMISFVFIGSTGMFERGPQDPVVASTKYGYVKSSDMSSFMARSTAANQVIMNLTPYTLQALEREGRIPAGSLNTYAQAFVQQLEQGGLIVPLNNQEQAMYEMLWEKKAEDMGIEVDDKAVNAFLQRLTNEVVTAEEIRGVMDQLRYSERQVFYALAQRLKAVRARELLVQNAAMATPATRLDWYRRTRSRATIEFLPVSVEPFMADVGTPSDAQLLALFEKYKLRPPQPNSPEPGFFQARRSAFGMFTANVDEFLKPEEVTEAEIAAYYEENKSFFPYKPPAVEAPVAPPSESTTPEAPSADSPDSPEAPPATEPAAPPAAESAPPAESPSASPAPGAGDGANAQTAPEPQSNVDGSAQDSPPAETAPAATESAAAEAPQTPPPPTETPAEQPVAPPSEGGTPTPEMFAPPTEAPKYQPLSEVSEEIRKTLAREKAQVRIEAAQKQLASRLRYYFTEKAAAASGGAAEPKPMDYEAVAKEFGMKFEKTDMLTAQELLDKNPLARAIVEGQGMVAQYAYDTMAVNQPMRAEGSDLSYVFWKTEDKLAYEPKFADVREQVLTAWKMIEARKLAQAAAEEKADAARKDGRPLSEAFAQADPGPGQAGPFGWLARQPLAELSPSFPQWMISPVPGVEQPGSEFMRAVFGLAPGELGVAWNAPETTVYVVRLVEMTPEDTILWQEFAAMPVDQYQQVALPDFVRVRGKIYENLTEDADLVWQTSPLTPE